MSKSELRDLLASLSPAQVHALQGRLSSGSTLAKPLERMVRFSLFFFGDTHVEAGRLYDFLLRSAKIADELGLWAIWTPERHFHEFGGAYPDPAVLGAALAIAAPTLKIRAGSVVLPINDTIRVAERWSIVDNLSQGRVGIAVASGWHPDDFVLARAGFEERKRVFAEEIGTLERLWRGETLDAVSREGARVGIRIYPRPVQKQLPLWITCSSGADNWRLAARRGANVLTGLLEQSPDQLAESIGKYRLELAKHGHDPTTREVALMLHTYICPEGGPVPGPVRAALTQYLLNHMSFYETMVGKRDLGVDVDSLTAADRSELVEMGVERYLATSSLIGDADECYRRAARFSAIGVDEIACLVNFGLSEGLILEGITRLAQVSDRYADSALRQAATQGV